MKNVWMCNLSSCNFGIWTVVLISRSLGPLVEGPAMLVRVDTLNDDIVTMLCWIDQGLGKQVGNQNRGFFLMPRFLCPRHFAGLEREALMNIRCDIKSRMACGQQ